jgi:hypothetical protein
MYFLPIKLKFVYIFIENKHNQFIHSIIGDEYNQPLFFITNLLRYKKTKNVSNFLQINFSCAILVNHFYDKYGLRY